jgi:type IV secretion system protein VirB3
MSDDNGIDVDKLAVGTTRPPTVLGVPYLACVLNGLVSIEAMVWTHNVLWLGICVPVHGVCYLITLNDPRAFEVLWLWLRTTFANLVSTRWYWSASSYSPLAYRERPGLIKRWRLKRRIKRENQP